MNINQKTFQMMGVINITPNSFSDGGKYNKASHFLEQFKKLKQQDVKIFDLGAESTAPFNEPITFDQEWARFEEIVLPCLSFDLLKGMTLSIDTYRAETFERFYKIGEKNNWDVQYIWNDVSGVKDDYLWKTLEECPKGHYIYSHTGVLEREKSCAHMDFVFKEQGDELIDQLRSDFQETLALFEKRGWHERLYFDPCFGFSKNLEQNLFLLKHFHKLPQGILNKNPWVIGISRKSFLKKQFNELEQQTWALELLQSSLLAQCFSHWQGAKLLVRLHDPLVFKCALRSFEMLS